MEVAIQGRRPVVVFGAWRSTGSVPASLATLLLSAVHHLDGVPLNLAVTCTPFARMDDVALCREVRLSRVVASRQKARVRRFLSGRRLPGDLEFSDWDVPAQVAARESALARLPLRSFIAVDRITPDGGISHEARPGLGQHASKKKGARLPQLRVLSARAATDAAIEALSDADLEVIGLSGARGEKTIKLVAEALRRVRPDQPALILADCAAEIAYFSQAPVLEHARDAVALSPAPGAPELRVYVVGQARAQYEEQFRFAMPTDDLSPEERELAELGRAAWRHRWRTVDSDVASSHTRERFLRALSDEQRRRPSGADRFNQFVRLLATSERDASISACERFDAVSDVLLHSAQDSRRVLAVVGSAGDDAVLKSMLSGAKTGGAASVAVLRQMARTSIKAESVVLCGYYGPATLDGALRAGARTVTWIVDPIEAREASWTLHRQGAVLNQIGLGDMADVLGRLDSTLREAAGGTLAQHSEDHPGLFVRPAREWATGDSAIDDSTFPVEELDADADYLVVLLDGTRLRVGAGRRFDVLRSQSPHPECVRASELQEGDEVLLVEGSYQETLSELLLYEMDRTRLQEEARARNTWVALAQSAMASSGLAVDAIVRRLRSAGVTISSQRVRSWLREDDEETTPRDWMQFLAFARAIGIGIDDGEIRYYFDRIKRWRVQHRSLGRAVVRAVRIAYFGGLSAADSARIASEWGLGVRDLIEGCRVEEVEAVVQLR